MNLKTTYQGDSDPFEGDLKIWLYSLPEGASIIGATVKLEPVSAPDQKDFYETFVFDAENPEPGKLLAKDWGVTKVPSEPGSFIEVDFHARRRLSGIRGNSQGNVKTNLNIDLGGAYVAIANDGTILVPNSDKSEMSVDISSGKETLLPGLIINRFLLAGLIKDDKLDISHISIISVPTNVSLRLGTMPPFWTHLGDLVVGQNSTDFANVLNAFLSGAKAESGFYSIPLVVHSDAISRLNVTISIDYIIKQSLLPSYLPEATLPFGYSSLPGINNALLTANLSRRAVPLAGTGGKIRGTFDASRVVFGSIGESKTTDIVDIYPDRILAQPILIAEEIAANAIDLPLGNTETGLAGLNLTLQEDADGKPSGKVLIGADISVERLLPGRFAWESAKLPSEFRFLPGKRYWLIIQSISGNAFWETTRSAVGEVSLQASTDGGISWRTAATKAGQGPLQASFRLRYTPARFSVPVQLQIGKEPDALRVSFDQFTPLGRIDFGIDFKSELNHYLEGLAEKSPCGDKDLIINGSFEAPVYDDATFKLLGYDSPKKSKSIIGKVNLDRGVDLSIQRFIQLAVDEGKPIRIDCAGKVPSRTSPEEIVSAINKATSKDIASYHYFSQYQKSGSKTKGLKKSESKTKGLVIKDSELVSLLSWCSQQIYGWKIASGIAVRIKERVEINDLSVALIAPPNLLLESGFDQALICLGSNKQSTDPLIPTILYQDISVNAGCSYLLGFQYKFRILKSMPNKVLAFLASTLNEITPEQPYWEVIWMDDKNLPIETKSSMIGLAEGYSHYEQLPRHYEARLTAPAGAVKASLRFIQPPAGILLINNVSFKPTLDALDNGSFLQWEAEKKVYGDYPSGWSHSGLINPNHSGLSGIKLSGDGPEDATLTQIAGVTPGKRYTLKIKAWSDSTKETGKQPVEKRARIELHWITNGTAVGNPVILPLDGRNFPEHFWTGDVPIEANQAEIRLVQPMGANSLVVESISFERSDIISVPLIFLSEAPGELTISDLKLVYDLSTPSKSDR